MTVCIYNSFLLQFFAAILTYILKSSNLLLSLKMLINFPYLKWHYSFLVGYARVILSSARAPFGHEIDASYCEKSTCKKDLKRNLRKQSNYALAEKAWEWLHLDFCNSSQSPIYGIHFENHKKTILKNYCDQTHTNQHAENARTPSWALKELWVLWAECQNLLCLIKTKII